ncbi:MAG: hypothetical protein LBE12_01310 [Planctomycetaceae bacterium]|nr:hypothetical protein [Planctomycetaceae bacterium]
MVTDICWAVALIGDKMSTSYVIGSENVPKQNRYIYYSPSIPLGKLGIQRLELYRELPENGCG